MKFALITEGASEHRIIKHILAKYFKDLEPEINQIQPKLVDERQDNTGGWNEVLKYCERKELKDILIENDYLVIQIDTDQSQTGPFNISHSNPDGQTKTPEQLHSDIIKKLKSLILSELLKEKGDKILFAVCIHTIECWLLPLCYTDKRKKKITNCLEILNIELARQNNPTISVAGKNKPNGIKAYNTMLNNLKRRSDIIEVAKNNFGFNSFVLALSEIS